jgi:glycosyltransferase involved in cell wall biosynthesis
MASAPQIRVLFIIRALEVGGAERQLLNLAGGLVARGHAVAIAPMYAGGVLESKLPPGVTLLRPAKRGRWDTVRFGRALLAEARAFRPTVVHGYMSGANEVALALGALLRCPVVWGIRVSTQPSGSLGTFRYRVFRLGCHLARWADRSIANSHAGRTFHVGLGYPAERCLVIPNGIDTDRFRPDAADGARWPATGTGRTSRWCCCRRGWTR